MNDKQKSSETQIMMKCDKCGYLVVQSEVDENDGNCPSCEEEFHPLEESS